MKTRRMSTDDSLLNSNMEASSRIMVDNVRNRRRFNHFLIFGENLVKKLLTICPYLTKFFSKRKNFFEVGPQKIVNRVIAGF